MDISLTIVLNDESRSRDLLAENTSCLLLEVGSTHVLINCGGSTTVFENNVKKLSIDLDKMSHIVVTSPHPRYYSAAVKLAEHLRRDVEVLLPESRLTQRAADYFTRLGLRARQVRDYAVICEDAGMHVRRVALSTTYAELVLEVEDRLLVSTPGLALSSNADLFRDYVNKMRVLVCGVALSVLSPDFSSIMSMLRRARVQVYLIHLTPPEARRELLRLPNIKTLYVGDKVRLS